MHTLGHGAPDILVLYRGKLFVIEIKEPGKGNDLTPDERKWHEDWREAPPYVCETLDDVLRVIGAI